MLKQVGLGFLACALILGPAMLVGSTGPGVPVVQAAQLKVGPVPNEIIVSFRDAVPADFATWATAQGGQVLLQDDSIHWVSLRFADAATADHALQLALLRADVKNAEHDGYMNVMLTPNDPLYPLQADWAPVGAPSAWDTTIGSHAVKVAILDTGVYYQHPDLAANMCGPIWSTTTEAGNFDGYGHGTHVAGTVGAVLNNGVGVAGASQSCMMSGKVLNSNGGGQWTWGAKGITDAANFGADIISMSWGGTPAPSIVGDAAFYAYHTKNVLLVAAAGNSGCILPVTEIWPAIYTDVLAVSATNENGAGLASFSSCGADVELAAPGANILSTMRPCSAPICSSNGYGRISGTSMATPHVSGIAALVKAQYPGLDGHGLRCVLDLSATDMGLPGRDYQFGYGRVNAQAALTQAATLVGLLGADGVNSACTALDEVLGAGGVPDAPTCLMGLAPVRPCDFLPI